MKVIINETVPPLLKKFDAIAQLNDGHFALNKLTWADIYFTGMVKYLGHMVGIDLTENHPNLRRVVNNTESLPGIKEWVAKRPKTLY